MISLVKRVAGRCAKLPSSARRFRLHPRTPDYYTGDGKSFFVISPVDVDLLQSVVLDVMEHDLNSGCYYWYLRARDAGLTRFVAGEAGSVEAAKKAALKAADAGQLLAAQRRVAMASVRW